MHAVAKDVVPAELVPLLRREAPVCQVDPLGVWVLSRYDDIVAASKNLQVFSSQAFAPAVSPPWLGRHNPLADSLLVMDPPRHTRLRALVTSVFTPSVLNRMEAYARDIASRLTEMML